MAGLMNPGLNTTHAIPVHTSVTLTAKSCVLLAIELNSEPTLWVKRSMRLRVEHMPQYIGLVSLLVRDYDEAIAFYTTVLGFELIEDKQVPEQERRWVVVAPPGSTETRILLALATGPEKLSKLGNQTGGRVFLFLNTDDFHRDYAMYSARGVKFIRKPEVQPYGVVAVFQDLYGNRWDLIGPQLPHASPA
jgi:catechol 2,3-dioxygenase-like lactoylglutathione lyase family enzyme